ncbi:GNAT family N-acetyltransferase [Sungkyunkwania multivorans]|uniref:GNAT family N-acetyltransferase n=1 Tax=Sungkyunkwania multivorans TaxID=1173618 RepID=A0ABW3CY93_9FLAO
MFSVREIKQSDVPLIVDYWFSATDEHLIGMGVDLKKMPSKEQFATYLSQQASFPIGDKQSYCLIWEIDGRPAGHNNINKIEFDKAASMHLHLWDGTHRKKGAGTKLIKLALPFFFETYRLAKLYCEPYALNPAPNRTLERLGFTFARKYVTIPGNINFEQEVNRWELSRDHYLQLLKK